MNKEKFYQSPIIINEIKEYFNMSVNLDWLFEWRDGQCMEIGSIAMESL